MSRSYAIESFIDGVVLLEPHEIVPCGGTHLPRRSQREVRRVWRNRRVRRDQNVVGPEGKVMGGDSPYASPPQTYDARAARTEYRIRRGSGCLARPEGFKRYRAKCGGPRVHSNHDFGPVVCDAVSKLIPNHSLRRTAWGTE